MNDAMYPRIRAGVVVLIVLIATAAFVAAMCIQ